MDMISIVTWNNGVCETTSGIRVYADTNLTQVSQEQCTGYALQENSAALLLSPIGSGIMEYQMQTLDANDKSYRYNGAILTTMYVLVQMKLIAHIIIYTE